MRILVWIDVKCIYVLLICLIFHDFLGYYVIWDAVYVWNVCLYFIYVSACLSVFVGGQMK